jgi:hypothetical protein
LRRIISVAASRPLRLARSTTPACPDTSPAPGTTTAVVIPSCRAGASRVRTAVEGVRHAERRRDALRTARVRVARVPDGSDLDDAELRSAVDEAGGDDLARGVHAARVGGHGDVRAHGDDPAVADEHRPVLDSGAAHGIYGAADDGHGLGGGRRTRSGEGASGGEGDERR